MAHRFGLGRSTAFGWPVVVAEHLKRCWHLEVATSPGAGRALLVATPAACANARILGIAVVWCGDVSASGPRFRFWWQHREWLVLRRSRVAFGFLFALWRVRGLDGQPFGSPAGRAAEFVASVTGEVAAGCVGEQSPTRLARLDGSVCCGNEWESTVSAGGNIG